VPKSLLMLCKYYAAGKIDFQTYRQQRREAILAELAIEGDMTRPVSNDEYQDVTIRPAVNLAHPVDTNVSLQRETVGTVSSDGFANKTALKPLVVAGLIIVLVAATAGGLLLTLSETEQEVHAMKAGVQVAVQPSALDVARARLLNKDDWWAEQDVIEFVSVWNNASEIERQRFRQNSEFLQLQDDIRTHLTLGANDLDQNTTERIHQLAALVR